MALLTSRIETRSQAMRLRYEIDLQEQRPRTELRTEYMAEEAINQLLRKAQPKHTFNAIAARVGGWSFAKARRQCQPDHGRDPARARHAAGCAAAISQPGSRACAQASRIASESMSYSRYRSGISPLCPK